MFGGFDSGVSAWNHNKHVMGKNMGYTDCFGMDSPVYEIFPCFVCLYDTYLIPLFISRVVFTLLRGRGDDTPEQVSGCCGCFW